MLVLNTGDKLRGYASSAAVVDYTIHGLIGSTITRFADGQLAATQSDLYTATDTVVVTSLVLVNTDANAKTVNIYLQPDGGTARRIVTKDLSLGGGHSLHYDGVNVNLINPLSGSRISTLIGLLDTPSDYDNGKYLSSTVDGSEWTTPSGFVPSDHKDTHDPVDGSDPLDVAAAVEIVGVQAAGVGTSHSFARADHVHAINHGITDNHLVTIDHADATDDEYARFTTNGIESRSIAETKSDLGYMTDLSDDSTPQLAADLDGQGNSLVACQSIANLAGRGAAYYLNGTDAFINIDDGAAELIYTGNTQGAIVWKGKIHDFITNDSMIWCFGDTNADSFIVSKVSSTDYKISILVAISGTYQWVFETDSTFEEDVDYEITVAHDGVTPILYINGKLESITFNVSTDKTVWFGDIPGIDNGRIGCRNYNNVGNGVFSNISLNKFYAMNVCPTATEVIKMYEGAIPYKFLGESKTEKLTNNDFSGTWTGELPDGWDQLGTPDANSYLVKDDTNNRIQIYTDNGELMGILQTPLVIGKTYRYTVDIESFTTGRLSLSSGIDIASFTAAGVYTGTFVTTSITCDIKRALGYNVNCILNSVSVVQIGCVLQLEQPGIGYEQWLDSSGNELHGTVDDAIPINLPVSLQANSGLATAIVPSIIPDASDPNTGIGTSGVDALSLIAGGVEGHRITESSGDITHEMAGIIQGDVENNLNTLKLGGDILGLMTTPKLLNVMCEDPSGGVDSYIDISGNNHHGTPSGTWDSLDRLKQGKSWVLDPNGTDAYIDFGDDDDFSFGDGSDDSAFTVFGLVEVVDAGLQRIVAKYDLTTATPMKEWQISLDDAEKLYLYMVDNSVGAYCQLKVDTALSAGIHTFAITYSGTGGATALTGGNIYIDGVLVDSTASYGGGVYVAMENLTVPLYIGASIDSGGSPASFLTGNYGMMGIDAVEMSASDIWRMWQYVLAAYSDDGVSL